MTRPPYGRALLTLVACAFALWFSGCSRGNSQMVERTVVQGECSGAQVALQIDRQQSSVSQHQISLPTELLGAATGGWGGVIAAAVSALGVGGAAAGAIAMRGGAATGALSAVVRGIERLKHDDTLPAGVSSAIDAAMRAEMQPRHKRAIRRAKVANS